MSSLRMADHHKIRADLLKHERRNLSGELSLPLSELLKKSPPDILSSGRRGSMSGRLSFSILYVYFVISILQQIPLFRNDFLYSCTVAASVAVSSCAVSVSVPEAASPASTILE